MNNTTDFMLLLSISQMLPLSEQNRTTAYPETTCLSQRFQQIVMQLHENQYDKIRLNGDMSEPFPITNGVKQGCVLATILFSIFFSMMLKQVIDDLDDEDGVHVKYRMDGSIFTLRLLQAHTKTQERLNRDLLFVENVAHTEQALKLNTARIADASRLFGLDASLWKTEFLHQPFP